MKIISLTVLFLALAGGCAFAVPLPDAPLPQDQRENHRILHIVPAYDVEKRDAPYHPLDAGGKFRVFADNTFDRWTLVKAAAAAGIGQASNLPHYGEGGEAFGKRFGAALGDVASYNFFTQFAFPLVLRQDSRYFRLGDNSTTGHRLAYALSRVIVTRNNSGRDGPNASLILGGLASVALSNTYYPKADQTLGFAMQRFGLQMGVVAGTNVLKEFWPGIRGKLPKKLQ